jgi:hypothetical protein
MRKTLLLGTLIALFGVGALAQARDLTATEPKNATEATQPDTPAIRSENDRAHRSEERREARGSGREHHGEASKHDDDDREHGRRR